MKLKILSGPFLGLEYNLECGDTVLQLVRDVATTASESGHALSTAHNVLLVATDGLQGRLIIRCAHADAESSAQVAEQADDGSDAGIFVPVLMNEPQCHLGLHLAMAPTGVPWSASVLDFVPPPTGIVPDAAHHRTAPSASQRWLPTALMLGSLATAAILCGAYYLHLPEVQATKLASVLQQAPGRYEVVATDDRTLYVFADDQASAAWAERAVRRADRWNAQVKVRSEEQVRVESWLIRQGLQPVIVRLDDAADAEIVLNGVPSGPARERLRLAAQAQMPYATRLKISGVSDATLVAMARDELKTLGVTTRADMVGGRTSVSNTVFLDDATLASMAAYSRQFERRWGARRVTVNARLWDDVLRGRSFRYAPGQLMSVGQGRWEYSENLR